MVKSKYCSFIDETRDCSKAEIKNVIVAKHLNMLSNLDLQQIHFSTEALDERDFLKCVLEYDECQTLLNGLCVG